MSDAAALHGHGPAREVPRRDVLLPVTAAGGAAAFAWPLIDSMNPARDVSAVEVDLAPIAAGAGITVMWQGKPVFVRHHTRPQTRPARDVPPAQPTHPQPDSAHPGSDHAQWIVLDGICTHVGSVPLGNNPTDPRGAWGGWSCPCHGSQYQTSGRVRHGPAPLNLAVPDHAFDTDSKLKIG